MSVEAAVVAWREAGSPAQGATRVRREAWLERFPEHEALLRGLPETLDRATVRALAAPLAGTEAFLVSQVWGYGSIGYGPARVRAILDRAGPAAPARLSGALERLRDDGPVAALEWLAGDGRLLGLGTSFATKFLYVMDPEGEALILDEWIADWLAANAGLKLRLTPIAPGDYARYLQAMHGWARDLRISGDDLEAVLIAAAGSARARRS